MNEKTNDNKNIDKVDSQTTGKASSGASGKAAAKSARSSRRSSKGGGGGAKAKAPRSKDQAMRLASQLVWANPEDGARIAKELLDDCAANCQELVLNLHEQNDDATVQASFALEAMAMRASAPKQEKTRARLAKALEKALPKATNVTAKNIVISYLQRIGDEHNVSTLGKCLTSEDTFEAALLALQQIGGSVVAEECDRRMKGLSTEKQIFLTASVLEANSCYQPEYHKNARKVWRDSDNSQHPLLMIMLSQHGYRFLLPILIKAMQGNSKSLAAIARGCMQTLARATFDDLDEASIMAELHKAEPHHASTWNILFELYDKRNKIWLAVKLLREKDLALRQLAIDKLTYDCKGTSTTEILVTICIEMQALDEEGVLLEQLLAVIGVLGRRGDKVALPYLMSLLHDPNHAIRKAAFAAVENLNGALPNQVLAVALKR